VSSTSDSAVAAVDNWHAAYNRRDVDALLDLALPDIEIAPRQPLGGELVGTAFLGHTGLRTLMRWTFENFPRVHVEWSSPQEIPGWVMSASTYNLDVDAKPAVRSEVFALFDLLGDRVRRIRGYTTESAALAAARPAPVLTAREREVFEMLARGLTAPQVADELVLSTHTVRTHVQNAMMRLRAKTRMHALSLALERGEIQAPNGRPGAGRGRSW
jgi:DNA-binding CsgD family transcriptional regulator